MKEEEEEEGEAVLAAGLTMLIFSQSKQTSWTHHVDHELG